MVTFSERHGYKDVRSVIQRESLDSETRMQLWNTVAVTPTVYRGIPNSGETDALTRMWIWHFKQARDAYPGNSSVWRLTKRSILDDDWIVVFDLIEALIKNMQAAETSQSKGITNAIADALNRTFETYLVGYRLIGAEITPIDSNAEAEAVSAAFEATEGIAGARHSLERATELLADRGSPDYPNSIKESISAVEAVVKKVTGEATLGAGLGKLETAGLVIHPALKVAWSKMYGWTSDADGIRHAGIEAADADQALAKYTLVTSSAFVSYLIEEGRKRGLLK